MKKIYISAVLIGILGGYISGRNVLPNKKISVAINSYFKPVAINDPGHILQKKITDAYSKLVDSLSSVYGFTYFPNYRLAKKHKTTFVLIGEYGAQHGNIKLGKYFVKGILLHARDSLRNEAFGLYSDSTKFLSEITRPRISNLPKENISYPLLRVSMSAPGMSLVSLVPYGHILNPTNGTDTLTSFSINKYITSKGEKDKKVATVLTNLMNNILVFNQHRIDLHFKPVSKIRYNYYPNYRNQSMQRAQYNVGGRLVDKGDSCRLIISFTGKERKPIDQSQSKIDSVITFNKTDMLKKGDYSNIIIRLSQILKTKTLTRCCY